jgi:PHP family Zn ribbon phosphoesterase
MIPPLIIRSALDKHIDILAITDHNATANIGAVQEAAKNSGVTILAGMEVQTREEVHSLCIFESANQAETWQRIVNDHLPNIKNDREHFGEQFVVDKTGDFLRYEEQLLITSTNMSLEESWEKVNEIGGVMIPAHIDRKAYGLIAMLGLLPMDIHFSALEISHQITPDEAYRVYPFIRGHTLIQNGDAHRLDEIIGNTVFILEEPTLSEMMMAFSGKEGRAIRIDNLQLR